MIREFALADQSHIVNLQEEFIAEFFPEFANDKRRYEWNADAYSIQEHYIEKGGKVWVAEVDGEVVGFGCLRLVDANTAEIKRVRIRQQHRGNGLGKSLIKQIESYCSASKISKLLVDTDDRFVVAKAMYSGMGYAIYQTEIDVKDGRKYTDQYYEKILQPA